MVEETARKIRSLEIQGATNVALAALEAVRAHARDHGIEDIRKAIDTLLGTRPTEPLMINTLTALKGLGSPGEVAKGAGKMAEEIERGLSRIVKVGARLIEDGMTVQTICHSSTVVRIIVEAQKAGKAVKVINTETRPRYQGHRTARELHGAGVPVKMYVDSAMYHAMKREEVDLVLVGVDAIFVDGSIANKIGTGLLALAAEALEVPLYAAGLSLKLDRGSLWARKVEIEERDPKEVWDYPVEIGNPAFEVVPAQRIKGIVTELGVLPPATAYLQIREKWGFE